MNSTSPRDISQMPYGPGGEGLMGHNREFREDRLAMLDRFSRCEEPLVRLRLPFPSFVAAVATKPETVQEMLVEKVKSFAKSDLLRFTLHHLAGEGLFTANGDLWKRQRKLMAPLFHPKALGRYADAMIEASRRVADRFTDGATLPILHETTTLTMSVAGKTLFNADTFSEADEIGRALTVALDWTTWAAGRPLAVSHLMGRRLIRRLAESSPAWARPPLARAVDRLGSPLFLVGERGRALRDAVDLLDARVQRMIDDRRAALARGEAPEDLLARLLDARDEDDAGARMSDRQVRDEILTLFVAGHETTATGLAWTIYLLGKHPDVLAAVLREVDALPGDPTVADLGRLELCARVFKEALRLYPPVYVVGRDAQEPVTLGGYQLPAFSQVAYSAWSIHRSPDVWPDPLRFDPDRFLPANEAKRHRYAWVPFGAGPRICIGNHFSIMEAQLALAVLLRRATFDVVADEEPEPFATLRPKNGVRVRVRLRDRDRRKVA